MKKILFAFSFFLTGSILTTGFYDIAIDLVDGANTQMKKYSDSKIIIMVFNPANPDESRLLYLDSIQKNYTGVKVLVIPSIDLGTDVSITALRALRSRLKLDIDMGSAVKVKRVAASGQHPLFRWLTDAKENNHFDNDVVEAGQMFVISEKGKLYAVLQKDVPMRVINDVLNNGPAE